MEYEYGKMFQNKKMGEKNLMRTALTQKLMKLYPGSIFFPQILPPLALYISYLSQRSVCQTPNIQFVKSQSSIWLVPPLLKP